MPTRRNSSTKETLYSVHPSVAMVQKWIAELPAKTGRSLEQWIKFVKKDGPAGENERREWLKKVHGHGTNAAWWIAERAEGKGSEDGDPHAYLKAAVKYVEEMYAGGKAGLQPLHDKLVELGRSLGGEVKVCPCKTIVPLFRNHVFAQIKPATRTRIDFGLALKGCKKKIPARLIDTGGLAKADRITHRIPITSLDDIDAGVEQWLKLAYDLDG